MSTISFLPSILLSARLSQQSGATEIKQSWLKSAEDSGLRDALSITQRFKAARAAVSQEEQPDPKVLQILRNSSKTLPQAREGLSGVPAAGESTEASGSTPTPAIKTLAVNSQSSSTEFLPSFTFVRLMSSLAASREKGEAAFTSAQEPVTIIREALQARNVTVLPTEDGLEVWLRDSSLTKPELLTWLAGIRHSMAALGASLVRLSLNGDTVYSFGQNRQGKSDPSGDKQ